jgi:trk system potassium uptake protein TrkA
MSRPSSVPAAVPAVLEAGIREAEILLAVTDSDEVNLVACLVADTLSPSTKSWPGCAVRFRPYYSCVQNHSPHIETVINPEIEVVKTIERLMRVPGAVDVGEFADGRIKFVGVYLEKVPALAVRRLSELPEFLKENGR